MITEFRIMARLDASVPALEVVTKGGQSGDRAAAKAVTALTRFIRSDETILIGDNLTFKEAQEMCSLAVRYWAAMQFWTGLDIYSTRAMGSAELRTMDKMIREFGTTYPNGLRILLDVN